MKTIFDFDKVGLLKTVAEKIETKMQKKKCYQTNARLNAEKRQTKVQSGATVTKCQKSEKREKNLNINKSASANEEKLSYIVY